MSTFKELQQRLMTAKFKSAVYQHLVDYLEAEFRPLSGADAKKVLMTDDKVRVPDEIFEQIVGEVCGGLENVKREVEQILSVPMQAAPTAQVAPAPVPGPAPAPVVATQDRKKSKSTAQGEVQS